VRLIHQDPDLCPTARPVNSDWMRKIPSTNFAFGSLAPFSFFRIGFVMLLFSFGELASQL
jgi:hypothetical protein